MKKWISFLVALVMALSMIPVSLAEGTPVYLAIGDSITTGYGLAEGEKCFAEIVAEANGYALVNRAVNGNTATGILAQLADPAVLADIAAADVITITCGGNDLLGMLYEHIAAIYNTNVPAAMTSLMVKVEEVPGIMANAEDPRQQALMLAAQTALEGNADQGVASFVQGDGLKNAITAYLQNLGAVVTGIRKVNPDVTVIVATQYNPYYLFDGDYAGLNQAMNAGAMALSKYIGEYAAVLGYKVADVYTAFASSSDNLMNASMEPLNLDFHPNAAGHAVIAQCVSAVLNPAADEIDKTALLKDAMIYTLPLMMIKATEIKITNT